MRTKGPRLLGAGIGTIVAAVALAGCSTTGSASSVSSEEVTGEIGFSFWGSPARAEKVDAVIDLFEDEYPEVTVTPEVAEYNAYVERMTVRAAGDGLPCVVGMQSYFATRYAEQGVLRPLDEYIDAGVIDVSDIPEDVLAAGQIDGEQFVIPTGAIVRLLAYNEDAVTEAGVEPPTDGMTWDQYAKWLRSLQAGLPEGVFAAEIEGHYLPTLTSWVIAHGEQMFEDGGLGFDRELLAEWFEYWRALTEDGVTIPPSEIAASNGALEMSPISTGRAATAGRDIPQLFLTQSFLQASGKGSSVGYITMPTEDGSTPSSFLGVNGIAITESCERPATAATFIDFFATNPEAGVAFQSDNGVVTSAAQQEALLADAATPEGVKHNIEIMRDLSEAGAVTTTQYPEGIAALRAELVRLYEQVAFGNMSVDEAVDAFFTKAESALN